MVKNWDALKKDLIAEVDAFFHVYEDGHFRYALFETWLKDHHLANWPRTATGLPARDEDSFDEQIALHPELPRLPLLRELTTTLN